MKYAIIAINSNYNYEINNQFIINDIFHTKYSASCDCILHTPFTHSHQHQTIEERRLAKYQQLLACFQQNELIVHTFNLESRSKTNEKKFTESTIGDQNSVGLASEYKSFNLPKGNKVCKIKCEKKLEENLSIATITIVHTYVCASQRLDDKISFI